MSAKLQIISLTYNFLFGFIYYIVLILYYYTTKKEVRIIKYFLILLLTLDMTFLYLILLYKINYGMFHIYYFILFFLGMLLSHRGCQKAKKMSIKNKILDRILKRP